MITIDQMLKLHAMLWKNYQKCVTSSKDIDKHGKTENAIIKYEYMNCSMLFYVIEGKNETTLFTLHQYVDTILMALLGWNLI